MIDPTRRFSSRVENYVKYRPGYPPVIVDLLRSECGLREHAVIADVGSGTGILAELLLKSGYTVLGVEPNAEMRAAGDRLLESYPGFTSVAATAEQTSLPDHSVDAVTAGQAFHWFDQTRARAEFARIVRRGGWVVLIWNERRPDATPFLAAYEQLLQQYAPDYANVSHRQVDDSVIGPFFAPSGYKLRTFPNVQSFDFEGLTGRLLSSSYAPDAGHPNHEPMITALRTIFDTYQQNGRVAFEYDTQVYYGQLSD